MHFWRNLLGCRGFVVGQAAAVNDRADAAEVDILPVPGRRAAAGNIQNKPGKEKAAARMVRTAACFCQRLKRYPIIP
ncbi:hypothetical protein [Sphingomonas sp. ERG5]|uniref:hypothetical protein n=1 Tax=Sphingomonas sp. ERG5 TaxID=1381597 RepID=UPI00126A5623|nr:hypothetical protein [Sphingomonas sp. ERG5]